MDLQQPSKLVAIFGASWTTCRRSWQTYSRVSEKMNRNQSLQRILASIVLL